MAYRPLVQSVFVVVLMIVAGSSLAHGSGPGPSGFLDGLIHLLSPDHLLTIIALGLFARWLAAGRGDAAESPGPSRQRRDHRHRPPALPELS